MVKNNTPPKYPVEVLAPVNSMLKDRLKTLKKNKSGISGEDPFKNSDRVEDNATDADAEEQFGHARTTAIKSEINRTIIQIRKALTQIKLGKYGICEVCGQMIDTDRLMIYPEATLCTKDARKKEK